MWIMHRSQPYCITVHCYTPHDWTQTQWTWTSLLTLPGEIIHSEALFQTQCHFLTKDDHWNRRMFDWRNLMASTPLREMAASDGGLNMDHVLSEGRTALSRPWSSWATIDNFLKYAWDAHREGHSQIHTCTHTHTFSILVRLSHAAKIKGQPAPTWRADTLYTCMHTLSI